LDNFKTGFVVPAYNPDEPLLSRLISGIKNNCPADHQIVIVDDGSESPIKISGEQAKNIHIIRHNHNLGKGAALKSGFAYFGSAKNLRVIFTMDADMQHPPEEIPAFLKAYLAGKGELIIGCRKRSPGIMPLHRILSNTLTSLIISLITGHLIRDSQCGYRLIETTLLNRLFLTEKKFHLESEMLIQAAWKKYRIGCVFIPTIYGKEKSSINPVADTLNFISLICRMLVKRMFTSCMNSKENR
jgi:glycosyltransferase involved in cell wall biosynthesis